MEREMASEYLAFVETLNELPEGQELELYVKDLKPGVEKYDTRYVRAIVSSTPDKLPGADTLWLRSSMGVLHPKPWAIKLLSDLGEYKLK
jgi:hypothetical protein